MARTKLTKQLSDDFCQALRDGLTYDGACDLVSLPRSTFYDWLKRAEDGDGKPWSDFSDAVQKARAERDRRYVKVIEKAADEGTWQAAAWFLERTNRKAYGRNETVEVTGKDGGPVEQHVTGDDQRAEVTALIDELAARRAKGAA